MKEIKLLTPFKRKNAYQFFQNWLCESWIKAGGEIKNNIKISLYLRLLLFKLKLSYSPNILRSNKTAILAMCGGYPDIYFWPFAFRYEIVPIIWDCWPANVNGVVNSFKRNKVKLAFFTSSETARIVQEKIPNTKCIWLPEGIKIDNYSKGKLLINRNIDVLELGRLHKKFHDNLIKNENSCRINHIFKNESEGLLFNTFEELVKGLSNSKITICFPRCDTHPEIAGNIETLTQRYWECMLSGTLILGRAPSELIELIGYNPVIDVEWDSPINQIEKLLGDIHEYQILVDKNIEVAMKLGSWDNRISLLQSDLNKNGYKFSINNKDLVK